nr:H-type small acid-soluble spore protein [Neobacillus sp. Marseille-Q6967]
MDAQRAQDISDSSTMANVTFNGVPVYIEHVDRKQGMATIHPLMQPSLKQSVPVDNLKEH